MSMPEYQAYNGSISRKTNGTLPHMRRDQFEAIYEQHWESLYAIGYNRLKSKTEVEDLIQELFLEVWQNIDKIRIKENIRVYLYTALKYKIIDHFRKRRLSETSLSELKSDIVVSQESTEDILTLNELYDQIRSGIEQLPERCRLVFTMSREMGKSSSEIAEELQISKRTVETQIYHSLKHLKNQLTKYTALCWAVLVQLSGH